MTRHDTVPVTLDVVAVQPRELLSVFDHLRFPLGREAVRHVYEGLASGALLSPDKLLADGTSGIEIILDHQRSFTAGHGRMEQARQALIAPARKLAIDLTLTWHPNGASSGRLDLSMQFDPRALPTPQKTWPQACALARSIGLPLIPKELRASRQGNEFVHALSERATVVMKPAAYEDRPCAQHRSAGGWRLHSIQFIDPPFDRLSTLVQLSESPTLVRLLEKGFFDDALLALNAGDASGLDPAGIGLLSGQATPFTIDINQLFVTANTRANGCPARPVVDGSACAIEVRDHDPESARLNLFIDAPDEASANGKNTEPDSVPVCQLQWDRATPESEAVLGRLGTAVGLGPLRLDDLLPVAGWESDLCCRRLGRRTVVTMARERAD